MARLPARTDHCEAEPEGSCHNRQIDTIWLPTPPDDDTRRKGILPTFCVKHWVELAQDHPAHAQHIYDVLRGGVK